jgi:hypothetical protein
MGLLYNIGVSIYEAGIKLAAHSNNKARLWCEGRKDILDHIAERMASVKGRVVWLHAA